MKKSFMERMAAFIVDKRRLFVVLFAVACVLSVFSVSKTDVNNELTDYLPDSTQTRQGLEIMNREFITYGDAKVMVSNVTFTQAEELAEMLRGVDGVKSVEFEKDTQHYNSASALFVVTFDGEKLDEISIQGVKNVRAALDGYDTYITTEIGNPTGEILEREMRIVLIILMCSIFVVLLLTSHTYAEVPVLIITFAVAVWVNKGTNYWFHEVSFITNSIAAVLQLGLGIDYAIIMCHHYTEERERMEPREATIRALTLAIPEISASSLTTISGLLALSFMKIKIGEDMSLVLIKAILFLMLTVFFLTVGLELKQELATGSLSNPKAAAVPMLCAVGGMMAPPVLFLLVLFLSGHHHRGLRAQQQVPVCVRLQHARHHQAKRLQDRREEDQRHLRRDEPGRAHLPVHGL